MRALITGITGQDGAYLARFLIEKGYEVFGLYRRTASPNMWRLLSLGIQHKVCLIPGDMIDTASISTTSIAGGLSQELVWRKVPVGKVNDDLPFFKQNAGKELTQNC